VNEKPHPLPSSPEVELSPPSPENELRFSGEGPGVRSPISLDAVVFALLCAAYLPMRFIIPAPPVIPGSVPATVILIAAVVGYFALDVINARSARTIRRVWLGKWLLVVIAIGVITLAPLLLNILVRQQSAPYLHAHDGLLQTEAATQFVLSGKNPYVETYYQTPMAQAPFDVKGLTVNPALEHFAYLPLTFLLPLPLQAVLGNNFDLRYVHLIFFSIMLLVATRLTQNPQKRLLLVMALGLNPLFVGPLIEGRNDVLVLSWLIFTWALVQRGKITASAITLALACGTKHPAVVFVPFYFVYLSRQGTWRERAQRVLKPMVIWAGLTAVIIVPWFVLNPGAFIDDTVSYLNGTSAVSYPISGFSFGMLLVSLGLLPSTMAQFPFGVLQIAIGLPVIFVLLRRQWRKPDLPAAIAGFALLLFISQFFSRIFNDNYLGLIIAIMAVAALMDEGLPDRTGSLMAKEAGVLHSGRN
jgi:hypothetical protein